MLTRVVVSYRFTTPEVEIWRPSKEYLISDGSISKETVTLRPNPKADPGLGFLVHNLILGRGPRIFNNK